MAKRSLLSGGPVETEAPKYPLLAKGFRPFFLLAAVYAALMLPLWLAIVNTLVEPSAYLGGSFWHAHEMLYGYTVAVIAGFLLTAIGNWTSRETATGGLLAALAGLWVAGRLAVLFADWLPGPVVAVVDLAFLPALAVVCARPLVAAGSKRNYQFLGMLAALFVGSLLMHLGALGYGVSLLRRGAWFSTHVIILMIVVMSARIFPMFTRNGTGKGGIESHPRLDRAAAVAVLLIALADLALLDERIVAPLSAAAGVLVFARSVSWGVQHTLRVPLLWILHVGHAFIALGLVLRGVALLTPAVTASAALHALTVGAIGCITLGMMARVSLGHAGRPLVVKPAVTAAFVMLIVASLVRVLGPIGGAMAYKHSITTSGLLFASSFGLFVWVYVPILMAPRPDGRPG